MKIIYPSEEERELNIKIIALKQNEFNYISSDIVKSYYNNLSGLFCSFKEVSFNDYKHSWNHEIVEASFAELGKKIIRNISIVRRYGITEIECKTQKWTIIICTLEILSYFA